jgi:hypothetical protein
MKYVESVHALFMKYCDDSDRNGFSPAIAAQYLELAYNEFRDIVSEYDKNFYAKSVTAAVNGYSLNLSTLAVPIVGSTVVNESDRLSQLIKVSLPDATTGLPRVVFQGMNSPDDFMYCAYGYYLAGNILHFSNLVNDTVRLDYIPCSGVDWTKYVPTNNEFIDNLVQWHDLIALIAYAQYAVWDQADHSQILQLYQRRMDAFRNFLGRGIAPEQRTQVSHLIEM